MQVTTQLHGAAQDPKVTFLLSPMNASELDRQLISRFSDQPDN
jgi:hypothetical protein